MVDLIWFSEPETICRRGAHHRDGDAERAAHRDELHQTDGHFAMSCVRAHDKWIFSQLDLSQRECVGATVTRVELGRAL